MLDRNVVGEFLDYELEDMELEIPKNIGKGEIVEAFCQYVEDDYFEWLKDNFRSFFEHGNPDWSWIRKRISRESHSF